MNPSSPLPAASSASFPGYPTLDLEGLLRNLRKHLWLIATIFGVCVALGLVYVYLVAEKKYQSTAVVYVEREQVLSDNIRSVLNGDFSKLDALKSLERSVISGSVILRVIDRLDLESQPDFIKPKPDGESYTDAELVELMSRKVSARLERGTRRIALTVTDTDPTRARDIAAAFIEEFEAHMVAQNLESARKATAMLEAQAERQLEKVNIAEEEIQRFREEYPDLDLEQLNVAEKELEDLNALASAAKNERLRHEAEVGKLDTLDPADPQAILEIGNYANREDITKLMLRRNEHRATMVNIRRQYEPDHPIFQSYQSDLEGLEQEVAEVALSIGKSIRQRLETAIEHERRLQESLAAQKRKVLSVDRVRKQYQTLTKKAEAANGTYYALLARINETDVTEGVKESIIRMEEVPLVAAKPSSPRKKIVVGLAGVLGMMLGFGTVAMFYLADRSLRTRKQIEQTLGLPVLAEIAEAPEAGEELQDSLVVFSEPHSIATESFRSLRTSLSTLSPRSVLLTSAMPGDGKSFCALNLALLQAQLGYRTLMIDADFRRPSLSSALMHRQAAAPVASEGALDTKDLCQKTPFPNLFLVSCAQFAPHSGEVMNGEHFAAMLWEAYRSFDCVIVDTSPLCLVSDALHFARYVDAVALVVKSGQTQTAQAQQACRELRQLRVPLAGSILNGVHDEKLSRAYFETYRPQQAHHRPAMALPGDSATPPAPHMENSVSSADVH